MSSLSNPDHALADGQPVWRAVSKPPAPKYTQQTDIALGGPFQRLGSSQLPRANSAQPPRSVSRPKTHPPNFTSQIPPAKTSLPRPTTAKILPPQPAELSVSQPSLSQFQSRIPVVPAQPGDAVSPAESDKSSGGYANDGRFASGFAQVRLLSEAQNCAVCDADQWLYSTCSCLGQAC